MITQPSGEVFVSYAREDRLRVRRVVEALRALGKQVWIDDALSGGQHWWDEVLARIRACDLFVQSISPASVESVACTSERSYARALGKPILPVVVERVTMETLPADLALLQYVTYSEESAQAAFRLARAVANVRPSPPLPDPLPPPPAVPVSYLTALSERVRAPHSSLDEQLALVARLHAATEKAKDRLVATQLLHRLQARDDLYAAASREIEIVLAGLGERRPLPSNAEAKRAQSTARRRRSRGSAGTVGTPENTDQTVASLGQRVGDAAGSVADAEEARPTRAGPGGAGRDGSNRRGLRTSLVIGVCAALAAVAAVALVVSLSGGGPGHGSGSATGGSTTAAPYTERQTVSQLGGILSYSHEGKSENLHRHWCRAEMNREHVLVRLGKLMQDLGPGVPPKLRLSISTLRQAMGNARMNNDLRCRHKLASQAQNYASRGDNLKKQFVKQFRPYSQKYHLHKFYSWQDF